MSRFLLTVWPFAGHINTNIAVAKALQSRGHEVAIYSGATVAEKLQQESIKLFCFNELSNKLLEIIDSGSESEHGCRGEQSDLYERLAEHYTPAEDMGSLSRINHYQSMYVEWLAGSVPQQVNDIRSICETYTPDVILTDPFMWGPFLVIQEADGINVAVLSYFAACLIPGPNAPPFGLGLPKPRSVGARATNLAVKSITRLISNRVKRETNSIRKRYDLKPLRLPPIQAAGRMPLYLVTSAPRFDYDRRDLPPSVHYTGPCLWDKPKEEQIDRLITQLPKHQPIVYVTEGTATLGKPKLLQAAADGLANCDLTVLITTGTHRDIEDVTKDDSASNITIAQWLSHSDLFSEIDIVVTHGGSGTVLAALIAGLPMVVVPMQWDHLENAQRIKESGSGIRLSTDNCTADNLRAAVQEVINDPSYKQNALRVAKELSDCGGTGNAVELLEGFARTSRSNPNLLTH